MEDPKDSKTKQTNSAESLATAGKALEDLLSSAEFGVRAKGVVLTSPDPEHVSGTSAKGREYSFYARKCEVMCGDKTVVLAENGEVPDFFRPIRVGQVVSFKVNRARMDGRQLVLQGDFE